MVAAFQLILSASLAWSALAQAPTLPSCAQGCANESAHKVGCQLSDPGCLCGTSFTSMVEQCSKTTSCSMQEQAEVAADLDTMCGAGSNSASGASGSASNSPASSFSVSLSSSSTISPSKTLPPTTSFPPSSSTTAPAGTTSSSPSSSPSTGHAEAREVGRMLGPLIFFIATALMR